MSGAEQRPDVAYAKVKGVVKCNVFASIWRSLNADFHEPRKPALAPSANTQRELMLARAELLLADSKTRADLEKIGLTTAIDVRNAAVAAGAALVSPACLSEAHPRLAALVSPAISCEKCGSKNLRVALTGLRGHASPLTTLAVVGSRPAAADRHFSWAPTSWSPSRRTTSGAGRLLHLGRSRHLLGQVAFLGRRWRREGADATRRSVAVAAGGRAEAARGRWRRAARPRAQAEGAPERRTNGRHRETHCP